MDLYIDTSLHHYFEIVSLLIKTVESNEGVTSVTKDDHQSDFPAGDIINDGKDFAPIWTMNMTTIVM